MKTTAQTTLGRFGTGALGLALLAAAIVAVILIGANLRLRADLTGQKLYSLSPGTRKLLGELNDAVVLKFYFNRSSPDASVDLKTYARQVEDLLQEYRLAGRGRVVLETYDPRPDSDEEEWAQSQGLEPFPTGPFSPPVYLGIVAKCGAEEQCLPTLSPREDSRLEYDITRLISRVAFPQKPVIGVLSALPVLGGMPPSPMMMMQQPREEGWLAFKALKQDYDVRTVPPEATEIDPEIRTLIVVHPKNLGDATLYAIDQFVLRGGRLLACVDPSSSVDARSAEAGNPMMRMMGAAQPSTLGRLFDAWGVGFDTARVVADLRAKTALLAGQGQVVESPTFLSVNPKGLNRDDVLLAQISQVMFPFAGALADKTAAGGKLSFTPLVSSSPDGSCLVDAMGANFATVTSIRSQKPTGLPCVLAARLQGTFKTAFPNGPPAAEGATNAAPAGLVSGDSVAILFADTDFLADENCVRVDSSPFGFQSVRLLNDNLSLFAGAVEQLAGRDELVGVRARASFHRPFTVVDDIEYRAMLRWQSQEETLSRELEDTRKQLQELQKEKSGAQKQIVSAQQQAAIERFRKREIEVRAELRAVNKSMRRDIENLGNWVKVVNIAAVPVLVILFGVARSAVRRRRQ
jgi:ABC-type uncharacterized transport system involved in gliding motility auxiliary subunit